MKISLINDFLIAFYSSVKKDELLEPIFLQKVTNWDSHMQKILLFWEHHLIKPGIYKGNLLKVHEKLDAELNEALFQRWLKIFEETAAEFFEGNDLKKICLKARMIGGTLYGRINNRDLEVPDYPPSEMF